MLKPWQIIALKKANIRWDKFVVFKTSIDNEDRVIESISTSIVDKKNKKWYKNNELHREDGPAVELNNGTNEWYINGKRHRTDGPAVECPNGSKKWYINGKLHREGGPAFESVGGRARSAAWRLSPSHTKKWYINGKLHREDGPAVEYANGTTKYWYINGKLHREDGPAVEYANGTKEWYINGKKSIQNAINQKNNNTDQYNWLKNKRGTWQAKITSAFQ